MTVGVLGVVIHAYWPHGRISRECRSGLTQLLKESPEGVKSRPGGSHVDLGTSQGGRLEHLNKHKKKKKVGGKKQKHCGVCQL